MDVSLSIKRRRLESELGMIDYSGHSLQHMLYIPKNENWRRKIRSKMKLFTEKLDPRVLLPDLIKKGFFSLLDAWNVVREHAQTDQNEVFFHTLLKLDVDAYDDLNVYDAFTWSLRRNGYSSLVEEGLGDMSYEGENISTCLYKRQENDDKIKVLKNMDKIDRLLPFEKRWIYSILCDERRIADLRLFDAADMTEHIVKYVIKNGRATYSEFLRILELTGNAKLALEIQEMLIFHCDDEPCWKKNVMLKQKLFEKKLDVKDLLIDLVKAGVISYKDASGVILQKSQRDQISFFMNALLKDGSGTFEDFLKSLENNGYSMLARELYTGSEYTLEAVSTDVKTRLKKREENEQKLKVLANFEGVNALPWLVQRRIHRKICSPGWMNDFFPVRISETSNSLMKELMVGSSRSYSIVLDELKTVGHKKLSQMIDQTQIVYLGQSRWKERVLNYLPLFELQMDPEKVLPDMVINDIISFSDVKGIVKCSTRQAKIESLIGCVLASESSGVGLEFMKILRAHGCNLLATAVESPVRETTLWCTETILPLLRMLPSPYYLQYQVKEWKQKILSKLREIEDHLEPIDVIPEMIARRVISVKHAQSIMDCISREKRNELFLRCLLRSSKSGTYKKFLAALRKAGYDFLADNIELHVEITLPDLGRVKQMRIRKAPELQVLANLEDILDLQDQGRRTHFGWFRRRTLWNRIREYMLIGEGAYVFNSGRRSEEQLQEDVIVHLMQKGETAISNFVRALRCLGHQKVARKIERTEVKIDDGEWYSVIRPCQHAFFEFGFPFFTLGEEDYLLHYFPPVNLRYELCKAGSLLPEGRFRLKQERKRALKEILLVQHNHLNEPNELPVCHPSYGWRIVLEHLQLMNSDPSDRMLFPLQHPPHLLASSTDQILNCKPTTLVVEQSSLGTKDDEEYVLRTKLNKNEDEVDGALPDQSHDGCESDVSEVGIDLDNYFKQKFRYELSNSVSEFALNTKEDSGAPTELEGDFVLQLKNQTSVLQSKNQMSGSQKENQNSNPIFAESCRKPFVKIVALDIPFNKEHLILSQVFDGHLEAHTKLEFPKSDVENETNEKDFKTRLRDITWLPMDRLPIPSVDLTIAHIQHESLDTIFSQMTSDNPPGPQTTMKYELLRICTYRNFPQENKPYSIRLAGAGFYYAAEGDELTCYCCGLRKRGWTAEDVPIILHERASPTCPFFSRNLDVNVPVPHPPDTKPNRLAIFDAYQETATPTPGAVAASAMALPTPGTNSLISESARHVAKAQKRALTTNAENRRRPGNMAYQTTNHPLQQEHAGRNIVPGQNEAATQQRGLGIDFEKPKHPQYAVKQVRRQSYQNWPENVHQRPDELVEAGFYYAGFGDCVRCFFCGIGLRHWSEEDNPWIEHARWSANCVYLRQVKGDEFVDLVQLAVQYSNEEDEDIPGGETGATESGDALRQRTPREDTQNYLLTDAAQSVLEMGYQPRMVQKAIDAVLKQKGREGITATNIMERVLEMEDISATNSLQRDLAAMNLHKTETQQNSVEDEDNTSEESKAESKGEDTKVDTKKILQQNKELKEQTLCKVCLDNPVCIVFLPCGHLVTCAECAPAMRKCPICRAVVKGTVKTYMA